MMSRLFFYLLLLVGFFVIFMVFFSSSSSKWYHFYPIQCNNDYFYFVLLHSIQFIHSRLNRRPSSSLSSSSSSWFRKFTCFCTHVFCFFSYYEKNMWLVSKMIGRLVWFVDILVFIIDVFLVVSFVGFINRVFWTKNNKTNKTSSNKANDRFMDIFDIEWWWFLLNFIAFCGFENVCFFNEKKKMILMIWRHSWNEMNFNWSR